MLALKNRHRSFLTRGIFGTTLQGEDPETRKIFLVHLRASE